MKKKAIEMAKKKMTNSINKLKAKKPSTVAISAAKMKIENEKTKAA
jgi:hypothetical protein